MEERYLLLPPILRLSVVTRLCGSLPKANLAHALSQKESRITITSSQAKIQEYIRFRIIRILQDNPYLTQREFADNLGMSFGGLNYCLNALINKGRV